MYNDICTTGKHLSLLLV